jgi:hypothetical protein
LGNSSSDGTFGGRTIAIRRGGSNVPLVLKPSAQLVIGLPNVLAENVSARGLILA